MYVHIIITALLLLLNIKYKTFRKVRKYVPSMIYVSTFNALYYYLCKHFLLWDFKSSLLSKRQLSAMHLFIANPLLILLFLSNFPNNLSKQFFHVAKWVIISTIIELIGLKTGWIAFKRGWSIGWSALLYIKMYSYSFLFQKHKISVLLFSIMTTITAMLVFKVPLRKQLLNGPIYSLWLRMKKKKGHQFSGLNSLISYRNN